MDQLPTEALLQTFKRLNSKEMVKIMRVCKRWFEIIDSSRTLWRRLVLPHRRFGWNNSTIFHFDRKSKSSLEEVDMHLSSVRVTDKEAPEIIKTLERSKQTLQTLCLSHSVPRIRHKLYDALWDYPNLVVHIISSSRPDVRVSRRQIEEAGDGGDSRLSSPGLKAVRILNEHHVDCSRTETLSSLQIGFPLKPSHCRRILEIPSQALKHLRINLGSHSETLPILKFPRREVLQFSSKEQNFPSWMAVPRLSSAIVDSHLLPSLPSVSVSTIWTDGRSDIKCLSRRFPHLSTLRIHYNRCSEASMPGLQDGLMMMLRDRRTDAKKVDGAPFVAIKILILPFSKFQSDQITRLRYLVDEVLDSSEEFPQIEVEI